ncbi:MAG: hypothetical protein JO235_28975 [Chroococcidiopsidaceae cyanobacterium CP_BM_RX_35]|nr:hypothetical protein [Chroococcidiopsidaceae cyanobacterium CP_BM_RX_35]
MNKDLAQRLMVYLNELEQVPTGTVLHLSIKPEGEVFNISLPNLGIARYDRKQLESWAREENLPQSLAQLTPLISPRRSINHPRDFLKCAVSALALEHGFGMVRIECSEARAFIATIGLTYRVHRKIV